MTEDEAKTKWCPFVRVPEWVVASEDNRTPIAGCNRGVTGAFQGQGVSCIGSACMAWRKEPFTPEEVSNIITHRRNELGDTMREALAHAKRTEDACTNGYCGLVGAAQ